MKELAQSRSLRVNLVSNARKMRERDFNHLKPYSVLKAELEKLLKA